MDWVNGLPFPHVVWFRLIRSEMALAAEVPASVATRLAWVYVRLMNTRYYRELDPAQGSHFNVFYVEVERQDVDAVRETDDYEANLLNRQSFQVALDEGDLALASPFSLLSRWLDDMGKLVQPWACNYPI